MVRIKNRYLLINILSPNSNVKSDHSGVANTMRFQQPVPDALTPGLLLQTIRDNLVYLYGDYGSGSAASGLSVRYLSTATSTAIIRVPRAHYRLVWAALAFVTKLPHPLSTPCVIRVVRVSGTIKKAEEEAIERARRIVVQARKAMQVDPQSDVIVLGRKTPTEIEYTERVEEDIGTVVMRGDTSEEEGEEDEADLVMDDVP